MAAHIPFVRTEGASALTLQFHVARANPIHAALAEVPDVLLSVMGPDAYISPDWYVSADQVPTWNYVAVHLTGTARALDSSHIRGHVDALSAQFEAELLPKKPWTSGKMTEARRTGLLKAIVGIEMSVTSVEGSWKLSQNKSRADRIAVAQMLDWRNQHRARDMAELMKCSLREDVKKEGP